jgi:hypothetical protein
MSLAVIDDSVIMTLINDTSFAMTIPCLAGKKEIFQAAKTACGTCKRKRQQKQREAMAKIKTCIANLSADLKLAIKKKLNAEKVRIVYTNLAGQVVQLTF